MGASAALGSALIVPLALGDAGWHGALLMLMIFPLVALLLWLPQWRQTPAATVTGAGALHNRAIWRSALCLAGDSVSGNQLADLLRDHRLAAGDFTQSRLQ